MQRGFRRSNRDLRGVKIGIPRVLNVYSIGPFMRTYLESLGLPKENVVFSPPTSEEMWAEGGRYGSIDPCFPSKVIQAHVHELLTHTNTDPKARPAQLHLVPLHHPCAELGAAHHGQRLLPHRRGQPQRDQGRVHQRGRSLRPGRRAVCR
jgi:hypothetical protein